jgi:hypothetical protein
MSQRFSMLEFNEYKAVVLDSMTQVSACIKGGIYHLGL